MTDDVVIRVENLGKKYRIRHQQAERYTALRDVIAQKCAAPFRALFRRNGSPDVQNPQSAIGNRQSAIGNRQSEPGEVSKCVSDL